jgi:hypothetical protein
MNYLQLAQRLRRKCRVSGTGPTALTSQSEEYMRLLDFVNEAYVAILNLHQDWRFMRASASCATVNGQSTYSPTTDFLLSDFGYWALDSANNDTFRNYQTAAGMNSEVFMSLLEYDEWRDTYLFSALRTTYARPLVYALAPDESIACGPIPASGYTLVGDYYRVPTEMTLTTSTPIIPTQFHMAIVYRAMMYFGVSESAPEVYQEGKDEFGRMIRSMETAYLRRPQLAGALA